MSAPLEAFLVSEDAQMRIVLENAARVGERPSTPVRIQGEVGTGKEVLARFIHENTPTRRGAEFVRVSCAAGDETALEAELFGRDAARGALERAAGGTLFLEDVETLPLRLQLELLSALKLGRAHRPAAGREEVPFDARVVAAGTSDLPRAVRAGTFRADLFHRLDVFRLAIPPLRERRADIVPLARWFLGQFARQWVKAPKQLSPEAESRLLLHEWPGNVRELRNALEGALISERAALIGAASLPIGAQDAPSEAFFAIHLSPGEAPPTMDEVERQYLERVLRHAKGNRSEVSRLTGLSYPTVARKIADYGLKGPA
jgi:two-component system, NtrC family, response regulator AtoC